MPLQPGKSRSVVSNNIEEMHQGPTYAKTKAKFGKATADKQAVAVALSNARRHPVMANGGQMPGYKSGGLVKGHGLSQAPGPCVGPKCEPQLTPRYRRLT